MKTAATKICAACGREFEWRKKWERNWDAVKYCSKACRKSGLSDLDRNLENAILSLLESRAGGKTICPSEAAREVVNTDDQNRWQPLMEATRRAARRLVHQGRIDIVQNGTIVDPSYFRGPVRLKLKQRS